MKLYKAINIQKNTVTFAQTENTVTLLKSKKKKQRKMNENVSDIFNLRSNLLFSTNRLSFVYLYSICHDAWYVNSFKYFTNYSCPLVISINYLQLYSL